MSNSPMEVCSPPQYRHNFRGYPQHQQLRGPAAETLLVVPTTARARVKLWQGNEGLGPSRAPAEQPADSDEDLPNISLARNAPPWQKRMAHFLTRRLHIPQTLVNIAFWIKPWVWGAALAWCAGARLASWLELGPIFVLGSIVIVIYWNLGQRQAGEASAYSIFNEFQALPGQLQADELDRQVRHGQM